MNKRRFCLITAACFALSTMTIPGLAEAGGNDFTLAAFVPDDVFLAIAERPNPKRAFVREYWDEIIAAARETGIASDVIEMIGSYLSDGQMEEVERATKLVEQLLAGVDWAALDAKESMFAQRMSGPIEIPNGGSILMPNFVLMMRGTETGASKNFAGLAAILDAIAKEVSQAAEKNVVTVKRDERLGMKIVTLAPVGMPPGAPDVALHVAQRGDVIIFAFGGSILDEVAGLMQGDSKKKGLAASSRYQAAFERLPAAEDKMVFVDIPAMLGPFRAMMESAIAARHEGGGDRMLNAHLDEEAEALAARGINAYREHDYDKALALTKQAHDVAPSDSRIMYNLACFHSLAGNKGEALSWLDKAVRGGFHQPNVIAQDDDFANVRDDERFKAALALAKQKAYEGADFSAESGGETWAKLLNRLLGIPSMLDYIASVEYTEGYSTKSDTIVALVTGAEKHPFYPVFGKRAPLADFAKFVPKEAVSFSVTGAIDLDELYTFVLDTVAMAGPDGEEALQKWAGLQAMVGFDLRKDLISWLQGDTIKVTVGEGFDAQTVLLLRVNDEEVAREKITAVLGAIVAALEKAAVQYPMLAMFGMRVSPVTHEKLAGFQSVSIGMSLQPVGIIGVANGHIILGSSTDVVLLCLETAAGTHPNITKNERVMSEAVLPENSFVSVSFTDERRFGRNLSEGIAAVTMGGGMAMMMIPEPQIRKILGKVLGMAAKLGPVLAKIDFYKSSGSCTTFDGKSWYARTVTNYQSPSERAEALAAN